MKRGAKKPKDKAKSMSMFGKKPFEMKAKKPEPDDRPRTPVRPASTNKNMGKTQAARGKRLNGVLI